MFDISFPIAFVGGVASFFAPCVVPLLPAYIAYVTGVSLESLKGQGIANYQKKLLAASLLYILGFSLVFVALGTATGGIGALFRQYDFLIQRVGGLLIILFGVQTSGFLHIPFLSFGRFVIPTWVNNLSHLRSFVIGILFALVWTPCVGVVLGSILTLAAVSGTAVQGASLLFVYSLGISVPFIVVALSLAQAPRYISWFSRHIVTISRIMGVLLIVFGILLLTDTYKHVNGWIFNLAFALGYEVR
ncbi:sulfite exporter TauE/SafE family protein [Candidatus Microgenomates bacterium]|nr:sulfite exporter TauE/SafE family protein [Candidatus Microgenomates bacterium]